MDEQTTKRTRTKRPSNAQLNAGANAIATAQTTDPLHREALDTVAAWLRHEATKGGAS